MKSLITGHLERISSKVFEEYHQEITKLVGKHHGVYALYKKNRLYYVGLATNLRSRVKYHLKDRHSQKWDSFSIFLIHQAEHLRELEALILHIAEPKGNMQKGTLSRSKNFIGELRAMMVESNNQKVENILGSKERKKKKVSKRRSTAPKGIEILKLIPSGTQIRGKYKGKETFATIESDGKILLNGKSFTSLSAAGKSIINRGNVNGWLFWRYKNKNGEWKPTVELL